MFENMFGGKSWYQSLTAWGLVVIAAAEAAVQAGLLGDEAARIVQLLGGLTTTLGLRKAATAPSGS